MCKIKLKHLLLRVICKTKIALNSNCIILSYNVILCFLNEIIDVDYIYCKFHYFLLNLCFPFFPHFFRMSQICHVDLQFQTQNTTKPPSSPLIPEETFDLGVKVFGSCVLGQQFYFRILRRFMNYVFD